jgi:hypothetical protein
MVLGRTLMEERLSTRPAGSGISAHSAAGSLPAWISPSRCAARRWRSQTDRAGATPGDEGRRLALRGPVVAAAMRVALGVTIWDTSLTRERVWRALPERPTL